MIDLEAGPGEATPDVLAVGVDATGPVLSDVPTAVLPLATRAAVEAWHAEGSAPSRAGSVAVLPRPGELPATVLVAGFGDRTPTDLRVAGAAIARAATRPELTVAAGCLTGAGLTGLVEGLLLGAERYRAASDTPDGLTRVRLLADDQPAIERGRVLAAGTGWARLLASTPASTKTPAWLADQARDGLAPHGVRVEVRDERWLAAQGFGGVLAVGGGSASPPRLVEASWRPRGATEHIVIVGKGITFDTGGLNLKPGESMRAMHTDMSGAAAAFGALQVIARLRLSVRVTVLAPLAENAVSGSSMRPSDIVRHYGGRTTEIENTDAEGRLVLADALAYAVARLRPSVLVDIATLTGAMKVALGTGIGGVFATDDTLSAALVDAGEDVDEQLWPMPLQEEYAGLLESSIADSRQAPGNPGAITAALFLRPFVGDVPWAHLDIAGPARAGSDTGWMTRGATGYGARLLARWIESRG